MELAALTFITFNWIKAIEILIIAILIFQLYKIVKGTVAINIFLGIMAIYIFWKLVEALQMELLTEILGQFIGVGVIALIIVFQQELRRFLLLIGTTGSQSKLGKLLRFRTGGNSVLDIDAIMKGCENMSKTRTGALMVIAKESDPEMYTTGGDSIDALLTSRMLESIFFKNSPLHDGAVIIDHNRIKAARCVLPVSDSEEFPAHLGMRHRAAVGITENSDALSVVVSEQTGELAFCKDGTIKNNLSVDDMRNLLELEFAV